ncbi:MAG: hypothetical protein M1822_003823 [Bathelium mastoideum]|nr:MAG: hypothetical protein M1822_003823 [Bathelium mastoideum]
MQHSSPGQDTELELALTHCEVHLQELLELLKKADSNKYAMKGWLTEVFELLLRVSFNSAADPMAVERALEICTKDYSKEPGQNKIYVATDSNGFIPGEEDISSQEEIEDAESERSGWATEEEWEEGYMLEAAVGKRHSGATNGQLSEEEHEENCTFKDYDKNTRSTSIIVSLTNVTMGWRPWQNSLTRV